MKPKESRAAGVIDKRVQKSKRYRRGVSWKHVIFGVAAALIILLIASSWNTAASYPKGLSKTQTVSYLNRKYPAAQFNTSMLDSEPAWFGCGCDMDPKRFYGYRICVAGNGGNPALPAEGFTVWHGITNVGTSYFFDDAQKPEIERAIQAAITEALPEYRVWSQVNGNAACFLSLTELGTWQPGMGYAAYYDGGDPADFCRAEANARAAVGRLVPFCGDAPHVADVVVFLDSGMQSTLLAPDAEPLEDDSKYMCEQLSALENTLHISIMASLIPAEYFDAIERKAPDIWYDCDPAEQMLAGNPSLSHLVYYGGRTYVPRTCYEMVGLRLYEVDVDQKMNHWRFAPMQREAVESLLAQCGNASADAASCFGFSLAAKPEYEDYAQSNLEVIADLSALLPDTDEEFSIVSAGFRSPEVHVLPLPAPHAALQLNAKVGITSSDAAYLSPFRKGHTVLFPINKWHNEFLLIPTDMLSPSLLNVSSGGQ